MEPTRELVNFPCAACGTSIPALGMYPPDSIRTHVRCLLVVADFLWAEGWHLLTVSDGYECMGLVGPRTEWVCQRCSGVDFLQPQRLQEVQRKRNARRGAAGGTA